MKTITNGCEVFVISKKDFLIAYCITDKTHQYVFTAMLKLSGMEMNVSTALQCLMDVRNVAKMDLLVYHASINGILLMANVSTIIA